MKYDRHEFRNELGELLFTLHTALPFVADSRVLFTPLGGSQVTYKVERVEVVLDELSPAAQDGADDTRYKAPTVRVIVSEVV